MTTIKISELPTGTPTTDDILVFVDRADGVTKQADNSEYPVTFLGLTDTPSSYSGQALKLPRVNVLETAIEFYTPSAEYDTMYAKYLGDADFYKYSIVTSVASGNLTVALKNYEGNDPTPSKPVKIQIGGVVRTITSALSIIANSGSNIFNAGSTELATKEIDYFVYLFMSGASVVISFSRIPNGNIREDFNVTFPEYENFMGGLYFLSAGTPVANIGRFNAILSAGGAYTWSIPATSVIINSPCYETRELNIGGDIQGFSSLSTQTIYYQLEGSKVSYKYAIGGTSNATNLTFRLPFNKNSNVYDTDTLCSLTLDNGVNLDNPGRVEVTSAYGYGFANILKTMSGGAWTASGYKLVRGQGFYNI